MKPPGAWRTVLNPLLVVAGFLVVWEVSVRMFKVSPFLLPPPTRVLGEMWTHGPTLFRHAVFSQLVPKIALAPLFVIWFGFGFLQKVLIAFLLSFFAVVLQAIVGFTSIRPEQVRVAQSMGASGLDLFLKVRLPHALPNIFAGLKMAMASSAIGAIVGEFIASQRGLGYLVLVANGEMNTPLAFAGMLLLSLMGVALYFGVEAVERLSTGWHVSQRVHTGI
jgi:NitT/TauT family transport system permease protein